MLYPLGRFFYKKMPEKVNCYFNEQIGKKETKRLRQAMRTRKWIFIDGPVCSGKTTLGEILRRIGYPYVIDKDDLVIIHTTNPLTDLQETGDIYEQLEIPRKCSNIDKFRYPSSDT